MIFVGFYEDRPDVMTTKYINMACWDSAPFLEMHDEWTGERNYKNIRGMKLYKPLPNYVGDLTVSEFIKMNNANKERNDSNDN